MPQSDLRPAEVTVNVGSCSLSFLHQDFPLNPYQSGTQNPLETTPAKIFLLLQVHYPFSSLTLFDISVFFCWLPSYGSVLVSLIPLCFILSWSPWFILFLNGGVWDGSLLGVFFFYTPALHDLSQHHAFNEYL